MKSRLLEEADAEFMAAAQWYENQRSGLGEQFISEVIDAFIDIERYPNDSAVATIALRVSCTGERSNISRIRWSTRCAKLSASSSRSRIQVGDPIIGKIA